MVRCSSVGHSLVAQAALTGEYVLNKARPQQHTGDNMKKSQKRSLKVYRAQLRKAAKKGDVGAQERLERLPKMR